MRVGSGFDVHSFSDKPPLILGGVKVSDRIGLEGHSDADVLVHAIMDAILGAVSLGDIGRYFPPLDPKYKDADSIKLLQQCYKMALDEGYHILNIDSTIMADKPRIAPYIEKITYSLSSALSIDVSCTNVKATTFEGLGFIGRGEGIMAQAVILMNKNTSFKV